MSEQHQSPRATIVRLSDVQPQEVQWLWPGRIALGKVTIIAGDPGLGKSLATLDMAARVSTGDVWPHETGRAPRGSVILLSAEDDLGDTIRPRLDAAGAAVGRIVALSAVSGAERGVAYQRQPDLSRDVDRIEDVAKQVGDVKLIVIDPVSAYMGKTDSHNNADVRGAVMAPLKDMAGRLGAAVVCVTHLRKGDGTALERSMGSTAFVAAARAAWIVARDPDDQGRRLFLPSKNNLAPDVAGRAYRVRDCGGVPIADWEPGDVTITADDVVRARGGRRGDAGREVQAWLAETLCDGPMPASEVQDEAKALGYNIRTVRSAYRDLGGKPSRVGFGRGAVWQWSLPPKGAKMPIDAPYEKQASMASMGEWPVTEPLAGGATGDGVDDLLQACYPSEEWGAV